MKQHPVPQNIMDVEFKLFGSLTAKQFGYIIAGGCIGLFFFFFFKGLSSTLLGWVFASLSVVLGLSLALIRINEQPFEVWLGNFLAAMFSSQKRVWRKEKKVPEVLSSKPMKQVSQVVPSQSGTTGTQPQKLIQPQMQQQIPVQQQQTVAKDTATGIPRHPFKDLSSQPSVQNNKPSVQNAVPQTTSPNLASDPQVAGKSVGGENFAIPGSAQGYATMSTNQDPNRPVTLDPKKDPDDTTKKENSMIQPSSRGSVSGNSPTSPGDQNIVKPVSNLNKDGSTMSRQPQDDAKEPKETFFLKDQPVQPEKTSVERLSTGTQSAGTDNKGRNIPDKSSVSLLSGAGVQQQIKTFEDGAQTVQKIDTSSQEGMHKNKGNQFNDVVPGKVQVITDSVQDTKPPVVQAGVTEDPSRENEALRQRVADYTAERAKLESELSQTKKSYSTLQGQNKQILKQMEVMKSELESLKQKSSLPSLVPSTPGISTQGGGAVLSPKVYNGPSLTRKPNVVSGIVKGKDGKLLPGVVVIIKNEKSRPVRAMKTNSLGQFVTTTALEDAVYTIELSKNSITFGRFEVKLSGDLLPTYEFTGN